MYSPEAQATAIPYRCINENLPRFLDNIKKFNIIKDALPSDTMDKLNETVYGSIGFYVKDLFCADYYSFVLTQSGIDKYNNAIGGYFDENGVKIQGLNEYINLFNQQIAKKDKSKKLPLFTLLYKQILSDREARSFIPEKVSDANDLLTAVNTFYLNDLTKCLDSIEELFSDINSYNADGIFIAPHSAVNTISNAVFGRWDAVSEGWRSEYFERVPMKKNTSTEAYDVKMKKAFNQKTSFSLNEIQTYGQAFKTDDCQARILPYLQNIIFEQIRTIKTNYTSAMPLLSTAYDEKSEKKLYKNKIATDLLKRLLDSIKDLEHTLKCLNGSGKEENKDFSFYGEFSNLCEILTGIDTIYDKVRNYMTQKPYSKDKIKLNFDNSSFLSGWAQNYETKGAMFFKDKNYYYIGIINKKYSSGDVEKLTEDAQSSDFERVIYDFQKPDNKNTPRLFIRSKGTSFAPSVEQLNLPINDIMEIYDKGYFKAEYRKQNEKKYKESLTKLIDYFKLGFSRHESYKHYSFKWKGSNEYKDIAEFYKDTIES